MEPTQLTGVTLDRLVAALEAAHSDVRDRIPDAMLIAEHLDSTGEDLIEHIVLTARAQGVPWSEIGSRMGVSKQAAQQRLAKAAHVELEPLRHEQGFTRFTVEARNVLIAAHEGARARKEALVTPARLAVAAGMESEAARLPKPAAENKELVPYDEGAQGVLSRAFDIAIAEGADMVDINHVVSALSEVLPTTVDGTLRHDQGVQRG